MGHQTTFPEQQQVRLPYWPDTHHEQANVLARSGIYSISNRLRTYSSFTSVSVVGEGSLEYMGQRLQVFDEDVFLQLLQYRRGQSLTRPLDLNRSQLLRDLGLTCGGVHYTRLMKSITRLESGRIRISSKDVLGRLLGLLQKTMTAKDVDPKFVGEIQSRYGRYVDGISQALSTGDNFTVSLSFIQNTMINTSTGRLVLSIDPLMVLLYDGINTSLTAIQERRMLCPAEKRLLTYINSYHKWLGDVSIEVLHELLGSDTNLADNRTRFVSNLKQWLMRLEAIGRIKADWSVTRKWVTGICPIPDDKAPQL